MATVLSALFQFVFIAILARLLSPAAFGLVAMANVVTNFANRFSDLGFRAAIVQQQDISPATLSTLYWSNQAMSWGLAFIVTAFSPSVAAFYRQPDVYPILLWSAANFLINPLGQQFDSLLHKTMEFRTLARITMFTVLSGGMASIIFALGGAGAMSLVWGNLVRSGVQGSLLLIVAGRRGWLPSWHFSLRELHGFLQFGLYQMGEKVFNFAKSNVDYVVIGRLLGPTSLGHYTLAWNLMTLPLTHINPIVTKVLLPVFSRIQNDDGALRAGFSRVLSHVSLLTFPMLSGLFIIAAPAVQLIYGDAWLPAVPVLQVYCLLGAAYTIANPLGSLLLAKGRPDIGFWLNLIGLAGHCVAVLVGSRWGIFGVAIGVTLFDIVIMWPIDFYIRHRLIGMTVTQYWEAVRAPTLAVGIMAASVVSLEAVWPSTSPYNTLSRAVLAGAVVYTGAIWFLAHRTVMAAWRLLRLDA